MPDNTDLTLDIQVTPYMLKMLSDKRRFKVLNWHRKARKTTLALHQLVRAAASTPYPYWYVSPSYSLSKRTIWDDPRMLPGMLPGWNDPSNKLFKKNESELKIYFPDSGGWLYLLGADRPDLMRGPNPQGVCLDEYSVSKREVWEEVIQPLMLINPKAWCWFLFTPRGKNHAYDISLKAQQNQVDWQFSELKITQSNLFGQDQIDNIKSEMSDPSFRQEMMCEFLEGEGAVFRHVRDIATSQFREPAPNHLYVMGVDLAKSQDYSVVTVYDRQTNSQVYQERWNTLEWPFQKAKIKLINSRYNNALCVLDATGLGDPISDDLARSGIPVRPFKFTNASKKEIIEKLSLYIEQRYIRIIPITESFLEFDSYEFDYTASGAVTYNARPGMHDDIVISHALAISELHPMAKPDITNEPTRLQAYYNGLLTPKDPEDGFIEWGNED